MAKANHTITGNHSLTIINELALAIETLAESVPDEQIPALPTFVIEGILVGIQHLARRINQLTQASLEVELVQGGEGI
jgi:hypothetical protein